VSGAALVSTWSAPRRLARTGRSRILGRVGALAMPRLFASPCPSALTYLDLTPWG